MIESKCGHRATHQDTARLYGNAWNYYNVREHLHTPFDVSLTTFCGDVGTGSLLSMPTEPCRRTRLSPRIEQGRWLTASGTSGRNLLGRY